MPCGSRPGGSGIRQIRNSKCYVPVHRNTGTTAQPIRPRHGPKCHAWKDSSKQLASNLGAKGGRTRGVRGPLEASRAGGALVVKAQAGATAADRHRRAEYLILIFLCPRKRPGGAKHAPATQLRALASLEPAWWDWDGCIASRGGVGCLPSYFLAPALCFFQARRASAAGTFRE